MLDRLADGRLRDPKKIGGTGGGPRLHQGVEDLQLSQTHRDSPPTHRIMTRRAASLLLFV